MSIFEEVKKAILGENTEDDSFDSKIMIFLSGPIGVLSSRGITNPNIEFTKETTWSNLLKGYYINVDYFPLVKNYVLIQTEIKFDPQTASNSDRLKRISEEYLWRAVECWKIS